jgi:hypothetical protein
MQPFKVCIFRRDSQKKLWTRKLISDKMTAPGEIMKEFQCDQCEKNNQHKGRFRTHVKKLHVDNIVQTTTATKPATTGYRAN